MSDYRFQTGEGTRIVCMFRDSANAGVSGATVTLAIRKDSDGLWWNGSSWQSSYTTVSMSETNATNLAGCYHYDFRPTSGDFSAILKAETSHASVVNSPLIVTVAAGGWVDSLDADISEVGSQTAIQNIASRLGNVYLDTEFQKLRGMIAMVDSKVTRLERKI